MNKLPNRSDEIYKEIESFEDYELTQCVAYEMAIRNDAVINFAIDMHNKKEEREEKFKQNNFNFIIEEEEFIKEYFISHDIIESLLIRNKKYKSDSEELEILAIKFNSLPEKEKSSTKGKELKSMMTKIINKNHCFLVNDFNAKYRNGKGTLFQGEGFKSFRKITKSTSFINNFYYDEDDDLTIERFARILLKRPKLDIPDEYNKAEIDITINLSLPFEEIKAYIKKIKSVYDKDIDHTKTPLELTVAELHKINETPKQKAKRWADMFFIYDYVAQRLKEIEKLNNQAKQEYEEKLQEIRENKNLSKKEKAIQKSVTHAEYLENCIDTTIKDIFKELEQQLNIKKDSISKLYYVIKPYIDESKYKELVTGISAL